MTTPYEFVLPDIDQLPGFRSDPQAQRRFGILLNIATQLGKGKGKPFAEIRFKGKGAKQPSAAFLNGIVAACTAKRWFATWHKDEESGEHTLYAALEPEQVDIHLAGLTTKPPVT